ncbi:hypothetical protein QIH14_28050, partial [Klebsiella pneumoniae]|nr:hypothetical protein [Klebsiella pneumoniae]
GTYGYSILGFKWAACIKANEWSLFHRVIVTKGRVLMSVMTTECLTLFLGLYAKCLAQADFRDGNILG